MQIRGIGVVSIINACCFPQFRHYPESPVEVAKIIAERGLSEEAGNAEFSADIFSKLFARPETWQKTALYLDEKTPGMGEKFLQVLRDFYTLVKTKLAELAGTNPEAETYLNNVTELENEAARMLAELRKRKGNGAVKEDAVTQDVNMVTPEVAPQAPEVAPQ